MLDSELAELPELAELAELADDWLVDDTLDKLESLDPLDALDADVDDADEPDDADDWLTLDNELCDDAEEPDDDSSSAKSAIDHASMIDAAPRPNTPPLVPDDIDESVTDITAEPPQYAVIVEPLHPVPPACG